MTLKTIYRALAGLVIALCANATAFGQYIPTASVNIPLSYVPLNDSAYRLGIQFCTLAGQDGSHGLAAGVRMTW